VITRSPYDPRQCASLLGGILMLTTAGHRKHKIARPGRAAASPATPAGAPLRLRSRRSAPSLPSFQAQISSPSPLSAAGEPRFTNIKDHRQRSVTGFRPRKADQPQCAPKPIRSARLRLVIMCQKLDALCHMWPMRSPFPPWFAPPAGLSVPTRGQIGGHRAEAKQAGLPGDLGIWIIGMVQAAETAMPFRFLRQPSQPITPRPDAKSGSAGGSGVACA
jgi:hypothetical protein